jgi:hypothetical protein
MYLRIKSKESEVNGNNDFNEVLMNMFHSLLLILSPSSVIVSSDLQKLKYHELKNGNPLSRVSIVKGMLSVFDDYYLYSTLSSSPVLIGIIFDIILEACNDALPETKQYGLQTLETWFNRIHVPLDYQITMTTTQNSSYSMELYYERLQGILCKINKILLLNWTHPVKAVRYLVIYCTYSCVINVLCLYVDRLVMWYPDFTKLCLQLLKKRFPLLSNNQQLMISIRLYKLNIGILMSLKLYPFHPIIGKL